MRPSRYVKLLWLTLLFSLSAPLAWAAPQPESGYSFPRDASVHGHRIDWLIEITMVFCIILFVIMCIWMALAVFKHGEDHEAEYDHGDTKHSMYVAFSLSAIIFLIVDGNLFYWAVKDLNEAFWAFDDAYAAENHLKVEINAHQWAWDFRYAGPDDVFNTADDIVTLNDFRVPVDTPVIVQIASTDVLHSFALPNFRVKMDAVPGSITQLWFQAKRTGDYDISCAQHCGTNHYKMKGQISVLTQEDYDAWFRHATRVSELAYDPEDESAHWGWTWEKL
ncbi:MAG: cytochrome c oxidase subunit II [Acidobacteriota bacterium]